MKRSMLIHEYRSSSCVDPNLPSELLPDDWLGEKATQLFQQYHDPLHEMRRRAAAGERMRYGLATLCVGVGQGCATIVERTA